ncbi:MAG TPA: CAP domain-containing protein [Sphingobium sp.]|nr:CAP domain-containing protein [Sphingobium sp.]
MLLASAPLLMGPTPPQPDAAARILIAHNSARAALGLDPLHWNTTLAAEAQQWAGQVARAGWLHHGLGSGSGQGENLWMGTRERFTVEEMVGRWVAERHLFRHARFPDTSITGDWTQVGHYTQIVWRRTREVGCGLARSERADVLVCRYREAGNVRGEWPY